MEPSIHILLIQRDSFLSLPALLTGLPSSLRSAISRNASSGRIITSSSTPPVRTSNSRKSRSGGLCCSRRSHGKRLRQTLFATSTVIAISFCCLDRTQARRAGATRKSVEQTRVSFLENPTAGTRVDLELVPDPSAIPITRRTTDLWGLRWAREDLNLRPHVCETCALTN